MADKTGNRPRRDMDGGRVGRGKHGASCRARLLTTYHSACVGHRITAAVSCNIPTRQDLLETAMHSVVFPKNFQGQWRAGLACSRPGRDTRPRNVPEPDCMVSPVSAVPHPWSPVGDEGADAMRCSYPCDFWAESAGQPSLTTPERRGHWCSSVPVGTGHH